MQISEICQVTGLTKKAIEYYQAKGLVAPIIKENGYREFAKSDIEKLKTIALLRKLDLTTDQIKKVLESNDRKSALRKIKQVKEIQVKANLNRMELLDQLAQGKDMVMMQEQISILDQQATIKEKLLLSFPGYYGRYMSIHFGPFLNEPLKTEEQKRMYEVIVDFLDNLESLEIPEKLQHLVKDTDLSFDDAMIENMNTGIQDALDDFEGFWETHQTSIARYVEYKKSESYQNSETAQLMELFDRFDESSGYYDIFIPAIRKLSPAYDAYYTKMLQVNDKMIQKMPELADFK